MRKILLLSIIFGFTKISFSQWTSLNSGVTDSLRGVYFLNDTLGWVCGTASTGTCPILKTTDGGGTWSLLNYPTMSELRGVQFMDPDTGIIVGFNGLILRSINGGTAWDTVSSGTTKSLRSVYFPSHDTGYACGGGGIIIKTVDAGVTWSLQTSGVTGELMNIRFWNNELGYAVRKIAGDFLDGYVIKTTDGGVTWSTVYTNPDIGLLGVAVGDDSTAYAGGNNQTILKTSDAGATWTEVYTGEAGYPVRGGEFLSADTGWMVGGSNGAILYTDDGGMSWTNQDTLDGIDFLGINFPSSNVGYAVGSLGTILKYQAVCLQLDQINGIAGPINLCSGDTGLYHADTVAGSVSYIWSVPGGSVIISMNGIPEMKMISGNISGNISVIATSGCDSVLASLAITINALPPTPIVTFDGDVLTSDSATTYQWYYNGTAISGATDEIYHPTQNGIYSVTITNDAGCTAASLPFDVIALMMGEIKGNSLLDIFPNPLITTAIIAAGKNSFANCISIYDVQGRLTHEFSMTTDGRIIIDKKDFEEGLYFVSLMSDGHVAIARNKLLVH